MKKRIAFLGGEGRMRGRRKQQEGESGSAGCAEGGGEREGEVRQIMWRGRVKGVEVG